MVLIFVLWDSDFLLSIHLSMLFMILQNFISLLSLTSLISLFRLERWSMLFGPFYEKHYIILTILVAFFLYLSQIYYILFTLGWPELYLLFKMWAPHGFVVFFNNVLCFILYFFSNNSQHSICFFTASEHWTDIFLEISIITTRSPS